MSSAERTPPLSWAAYVPLALITASPNSPEFDHIHARAGFISEGGEVASSLKRVFVYGKRLDDPGIRANLREELGDWMWYIPILARGEGIVIADPVDGLFDPPANVGEAILRVGRLVSMFFDPDSQFTPRTRLHLLQANLDILCQWLGFDPCEIRAENIDKLKKRYPDGFSAAAAEARADKGGLSHKES